MFSPRLATLPAGNGKLESNDPVSELSEQLAHRASVSMHSRLDSPAIPTLNHPRPSISPSIATKIVHTGSPLLDLPVGMRAVSPPTPAPSPPPLVDAGHEVSFANYDIAATPASSANLHDYSFGAAPLFDGSAGGNYDGASFADRFIDSVCAQFSLLSPADRRAFFTALVPTLVGEDLLHVSRLVSPRLRRDFLAELPAEIALQVLSFIDDPKDLVRAARVSKTWRGLVSDEQTWKFMLQKYHIRGWSASQGNRTRPPIERIRQTHPQASFGVLTSPTAITNTNSVVYPHPASRMHRGDRGSVASFYVPSHGIGMYDEPPLLAPRIDWSNYQVSGGPVSGYQRPIHLAYTSGNPSGSTAALEGRQSVHTLSPTARPFRSRQNATEMSIRNFSASPFKHLATDNVTQPSIEPRPEASQAARASSSIAEQMDQLVESRSTPSSSQQKRNKGKGKGRMAAEEGVSIYPTDAKVLSAPRSGPMAMSVSPRRESIAPSELSPQPWQISGLGFAARRSSHAPNLSRIRTHHRAAAASSAQSQSMQPIAEPNVNPGPVAIQPPAPLLLHHAVGAPSTSGEPTSATFPSGIYSSPAADATNAHLVPEHAVSGSGAASSPLATAHWPIPSKISSSSGSSSRQTYALRPPPVRLSHRSRMRSTSGDIDSSLMLVPDSPEHAKTDVRTTAASQARSVATTRASVNPFGTAVTVVQPSSENAQLTDQSKDSDYRQSALEQPLSYKTQFKKAYLTESNWLHGPGRLLSRQTSSDESVITCLGFDSEWIIVGMANNQIHAFDANTGEYVRQLAGHTAGVWCLVLVSRGGQPVRSAGNKENAAHSATADEGARTESDEEGLPTSTTPAARLKRLRSASARPAHVDRFPGLQSVPNSLSAAPCSRTSSAPVVDEKTDNHLKAPSASSARLNRRPSSFCGVSNVPGSASINHRRPGTESGYPFGDDANLSLQQAAACGTACGWGQDDAVAVSSGCDRDVRVWDVATGRCKFVLRGHMSTVRCLKVVNGRPIAISGSRDATMRVWDIERGALLHLLSGHQHSVRCIEISGNIIVSGSYDSTCRVWDVDTGECLHLLRGHQHQIYAVAFDGVRIATGSLDSTVRIWSAATGESLALLQGHTSLVGQLQLTNSVLVTGGSDGRVIIFSLSTFECLHRLCAHDNSVTCLQFNDRFMVTGGNDGKVKLWDVPSGKLIRELSEPCEAVWRVTFREDKCVLLCRRNGKTVIDVRTFAPRDEEL